MCRAYKCADNADTANSGLSDYEADNSLTLPSDKCINPDSCIMSIGYEESGSNCICY